MWTLLIKPKVIVGILIVLVVVGLTGTIKIQSMRIDSLQKKIEKKDLEIVKKQALIDDMEHRIVEQNASIQKWEEEANLQKAKVREANRKADERMKNLGKSLQEILTAKLPSKQEVEWANKQLEEILKEW